MGWALCDTPFFFLSVLDAGHFLEESDPEGRTQGNQLRESKELPTDTGRARTACDPGLTRDGL